MYRSIARGIHINGKFREGRIINHNLTSIILCQFRHAMKFNDCSLSIGTQP